MTSLYSYTEGLRGETGTIPQGATTLAERLRAAGYVTASIITNPFVGRASGLDRGFDYLMESPVVMRQHSEEADGGTDSAAMNKVVMPWLEQHRDEPFFLYAHTSDPHAPYIPPKGFKERFADPAGTAQINRAYWKIYDQQKATNYAITTRESCRAKGLDPDRFLQEAIDRYDGEIAFCDHSFEQLIGKLKDLGVLENTLVIVVSDHGEEFWDHGFNAHGHSLHRELLHTLMLFWNPKLLPAPRRVGETVQLIDLPPTILELIGAQPKGIVQGSSLVPLLKGSAFHRQNPVMSSQFAHFRAGPETLIPENRTDAFAIWRDNWKMIYHDKAQVAGVEECELYDRADAAEKSNLAAKRPEVVKELMAEIRQWIQEQDKVKKLLGPGSKSELDQQSIERLRSLGYLGGKAKP
jgi:arylsulfatase A-like enzyme